MLCLCSSRCFPPSQAVAFPKGGLSEAAAAELFEALPVTLMTLRLEGCHQVKALPPGAFGKLRHLRSLALLGWIGLTSLPESLGNLVELEMLDLSRCMNLTSLPESVGKLVALETLNLGYCVNLTSLPESVGKLVALKTLNLERCFELTSLPPSVRALSATGLRIMGGPARPPTSRGCCVVA